MKRIKIIVSYHQSEKVFIYKEYCTFLFKVFDGLEARLPELFVDPVQEKFLYRKFGYLGEC